MTRWRTRHRGADRGAAAVEFAIVLVVLLLIIFAIIDFGRLFFAVQSMKAASREGARTAAVRACWSVNAAPCVSGAPLVLNVTRDAGSTAAALAGGALTVTGTRGGTTLNETMLSGTNAETRLCTTAGDSVTVTASTGFRWFTPAGFFARTINSASASTTMRCE